MTSRNTRTLYIGVSRIVSSNNYVFAATCIKDDTDPDSILELGLSPKSCPSLYAAFLASIRCALNLVDPKTDSSVTIYTSATAVKCFSGPDPWYKKWESNGWKKGDGNLPANLDLIRDIVSILRSLADDGQVHVRLCKPAPGDLQNLCEDLNRRARNVAMQQARNYHASLKDADSTDDKNVSVAETKGKETERDIPVDAGIKEEDISVGMEKMRLLDHVEEPKCHICPNAAILSDVLSEMVEMKESMRRIENALSKLSLAMPIGNGKSVNSLRVGLHRARESGGRWMIPESVPSSTEEAV